MVYMYHARQIFIKKKPTQSNVVKIIKITCTYFLHVLTGEWNVTSDPLPDPGSPEHQEMWQMRMREVVTERTNQHNNKIMESFC